MKILFIDHDRRNSGSTVSIKYYLERLIADGYELSVLCTHEKVQYYKNTFCTRGSLKIIPFIYFDLNIHFSDNYSFNINTIYIILKNIFKLGIGAWKSIIMYYNIRPDIVIVNEYVAIHLSFYLAFCKTPVLCFIRSKIFNKQAFISSIIKNIILNTSTALICITEIEASQFKNNKKEIHLLRESVKEYPISLPRFDFNLLRFVFVGGVNEIKGTLVVLSAFRLLLENNYELTLTIVGNVEYSNENYCNMCYEIINKYPSNIKILGEQVDLGDIYSSSQVLISANTESHFSRPIIEAFANGLAVIASDVQHNRLLVKNNENGFLFRNGSYHELFMLITKILENPSILGSIIIAGYNSLEKYSQPMLYLEFKSLIAKYHKTNVKNKQ